jgi:hypothetical protein
MNKEKYIKEGEEGTGEGQNTNINVEEKKP